MSDVPASGDPSAAAAPDAAPTLAWRDGRVMATLPGAADAIPVRLLRARPITAPQGEVALLDDKKRAVALLDGVHVLDGASREVATRALDETGVVPRIRRVHSARPRLGTYYWHVDTDRGERRFAIKAPHRSIIAAGEGRLLLRDVVGNRYEIISVGSLDRASQVLVAGAM